MTMQGFFTLPQDLCDLFRQFFVPPLLILRFAERSLRICHKGAIKTACLVEFGAFRNLGDDTINLILILN